MDARVFHRISYGLYIVGSRRAADRRDVNVQIANTLVQVSAEPAHVSVAVHRDNYTHEYIEDSGVYSACILSRDAPLELIGRFGFHSGRDGSKLGDVEHHAGETGCPIVVPNVLGAVEARVVESVRAATHTLFIGEVVAARVLAEGEPLTYAHYHEVKKGKSPRRAPIPDLDDEDEVLEDVPARTVEGRRYRCTVCGYIYDPSKEGKRFEDLPDDWSCPVCGAGKDDFEPV
jgi:flavin reductase (DIM6/NTAB) family NADH-FMN oxidoreductase RutF/rubredoxin